MTTTQSILEIVARYQDQASSGMGKTAKSADDAEKALARMQERLALQARSADLASKSLQLTQNAYDKNKQTLGELTSQLEKTIAAEGKESQAATQLAATITKLTATNERLSQSIDRKQLALDKSVAAIARTRDSADQMAQSLTKQATQAEKSGTAFSGLVTKLTGLAAGFASVSVIAGKFVEGFNLVATLDQNRRTLGTLLGDVEKGNKVYQEAIAFGQKFGFTQQEIASSAAAASGILKNTNQTTEQTLAVLARLASLNPAEGIEGATVALKELASGDIVSLAERFNVSKQAANEMKQAIADGADPVQVLDDALTKMGVTSDVLSQRMDGPAGAALKLKLANENVTKSIGDFLIAINVPGLLENFAAGLNNLAQGFQDMVQQVSAARLAFGPATQDIANVTAIALNSGKTYEQYAQAMRDAGFASEMFGQSQYTAAQGLVANGSSAQDAANSVSGLKDVEDQLRDVLFRRGEAAGMSEQQTNALIDRTLSLASANPQLTSTIYENIDALNNNGMSATDFASSLDNLSSAAADDASMMQQMTADHEYAAAQMQSASDIGLMFGDTLGFVADAALYNADAAYQMSDANYESANATMQAQIAAAEKELQDIALANVMRGVTDGSYGVADAQLMLAQQLNITNGQAAQLINTFIRLQNVQAQLGAAKAGAGAAAAVRQAQQIAQAEQAVVNAGRTPVARASGGSAGRASRAGGGRSSSSGRDKTADAAAKARAKEEAAEEKTAQKIEQAREKLHDKLVQAEQKHNERIADINAKHRQQELEAEQKFNADKFKARNDFKESILDLDQDLYDQARAEESAYWDVMQQIAQSGDAQRAQQFQQAANDYVAMKAQHAQELRDLDQQIANEEDAAERAKLETKKQRLQELYAEQEKYAAENIDKIRNGQEEIDKQRDEAIAKENADYAEQQHDIKQEFSKTIEDLIGKQNDQLAAQQAWADATIALFNSVRDAANNSHPSGGGGEGSGEGSGDSAPSEGRAGGGTVRRGVPVWVGENEPEIFVPGANGTILNRKQILAALARDTSSRMPNFTAYSRANIAPTAYTQQAQTTNTTQSITLENVNLPNVQNPRQFIALMEQIADRRINGANKTIGQRSINTRRSGS